MNNYKSTIFLIMNIALIGNLKSQEIQNPKDNIYTNDIYFYNSIIKISPIYVSFAPRYSFKHKGVSASDGGYSIGYDLAIKKFCSINFSVQADYKGLEEDEHYPRYTTLNKLRPYLQAESGIEFHIKDTLLKNTSLIANGIVGNTIFYRKIWAFRLGAYYYHRKIIDYHEGSEDLGVPDFGGIVASDGTPFGGAAMKDPNYSQYALPGKIMAYYPCAYVGISRKIFTDDVSLISCYSKKTMGHRTYLNFYGDVLLGVPIIEKYHTFDGKIYDVSGKGSGYEKKYVGARLGVEYHFGKITAWYLKSELISVPRITDRIFRIYNNPYLRLTLGMSLFSKIKKITVKKIHIIEDKGSYDHFKNE